MVSFHLLVGCAAKVMEEAAQVLEVETIIPMLLQPATDTAMKAKQRRKVQQQEGAMDEDGNDEDEDEDINGGANGNGNESGGGGRLLRVCLIGDHRK